MTTIAHLPNEILWRIADHLDNSDFIELVCVSSLCNRIFRSQRYRTVEIKTKAQLTKFTKTLEDSVKKRRRRKAGVPDTPYVGSLGESIRSLALQDGMLTTKSMEKIAKLCPRVTSMDYSWSDSTTSDGNHKPLTRLFYTPVPFFDHFRLPTLTSLSLKGKFPIDPMTILAPVLCRLPHLTYLKITHSFKMTMANIEEIHSLCPRLQQLLFTKPMLLDMDDMSIPYEEMELLVPAPALESLSLPSEIWAHQHIIHTHLFKYITLKYPKLKNLNISAGSHALGYINIEGKPSTGSVKTLVLRKYFEHLENLRLGEFGRQSSTELPLLFKGISKVTLDDEWLDDERASANFSNWIRHSATNKIERLHLNKAPQQLDNFRYNMRLRELSLGSISSLKSQKLQQLPIDTLISSCLALNKLTITGCYIHHKSNTKATSLLNTLILRRSVFHDNNVLTRVGERCPKLTHLDLYSCRWRSSQKNPVIRISMRHQSFSFLRISEPGVCKELNSVPDNNGPPAGSSLCQDKGLNECLLVKTSDRTPDNFPLFWTAQKPLSLDTVVTRISDPVILEWLDRLEANGGRPSTNSTRRRKAASDALKTLRASADLEDHDPSKMDGWNFWSTVVRCHRVDRFYCDDIRLDFENDNFTRQKPKYLEH